MTYTIKVKNNDSVSHTWVAKTLSASEEYTLSVDEFNQWASNDTFLAAITAGQAIIGDASQYFTSTAEMISHLQGDTPRNVNLQNTIETSGVKNPNGMRARLIGIMNSTVTADTTKDIDWLCPQLQYNGVDKKSYFDGIQYYAKDAEIGDKASFQVVDKDGVGVVLGWYDQATFDAMGNLYVVEEFGDSWFMIPNTMEDLMLYKASVVPGLYIRMKYTSVGNVNVNVVVNLFRHMDGNS